MAPADLFYEQTRFMKEKQPQRSNGQQQASLCETDKQSQRQFTLFVCYIVVPGEGQLHKDGIG
ncbi:hypothetical protein T12_14183 [Trichinella patagoniensis]|uniref:Uncharacterized protein n=1 Tax=Trichinella patagoniensis TaxID=990121 RepID=A0A0V1A629_9BILA|nr:hypothetical protein T12_14183 [Trichinella patagoniensis]